MDWALSQFAERADLAAERFGTFVEDGLGEGHRKEFHGGSFEGRALGNDTFIDQALLKAEETRQADITLEQVIESVCSLYQLSSTELCAPGKGQPAAEARGVAARVVRNTDSLPLSELAEFLNRDLSGLSQAALRIERRAGADDLLSRKLDRMMTSLGISVCQA
jgi:chromosomal replication initiation ATPase DnaA